MFWMDVLFELLVFVLQWLLEIPLAILAERAAGG